MRIIAIVGVLILGTLYFFSIINQVNRNIERSLIAENLTLDDFTEEEYEITEVWKRSIERKNVPSSKQSYIFFKVKDRAFKFNMGIGMTDFGERTPIGDVLTEYLYTGAKVRVLANKEDIAYASDNSLLRTVSDFLSGTNKEVEVYRLSVDDEVIFSQDIHTAPFSNRSFADMALGQNLLYLILGGAVVYALIYHTSNFIKRRKNTN